jgi:hypothetical protein
MNRALLPVGAALLLVSACVVFALRARAPEAQAGRSNGVDVGESAVQETRRRTDLRIAVMNEWRGHIFPCQCQAKDLGDSAAQIGELSLLRGGRGVDAVLYIGDVLGSNPDDEDENTLSARSSAMRRELCFTVLTAAKPLAIVPGPLDWKDRRGSDRLRRAHAVVCTNATFDGPLRELEFPAGDVVVRLLGFVLARPEDERFSDAATKISESVSHASETGVTRRLEVVGLCVDEETSTDDLLRALRAAGAGTIVAIGGKIEAETWNAAARDAESRGIALMRSDVLGQQWGVLSADVRTSGAGASWRRRAEDGESPPVVRGDDLYSVDVVPIKDKSPRDPAIAEALSRYKTDMESLVNERRRRAATTPSPYHGQAACAACHQAIARQWAATSHARAFTTLVSAGRDKDPQCLACHATGFGAEGGYVAADVVPDLAGVQCESCHGAGGSHRDAGTPTTGKPRETCAKCHDPMNSPHFRMDGYLPRVACRKIETAPQPRK